MRHLASFKLAQGGIAPGVGCYWESRPSCRTGSLKHLLGQMRINKLTFTSLARAGGFASLSKREQLSKRIGLAPSGERKKQAEGPL